MGSAKLSTVTLLSRADPNSVLLRGFHNDVLVSDILNESAIFSKLHVNTLTSMMHGGVSESDVLNDNPATDRTNRKAKSRSLDVFNEHI